MEVQETLTVADLCRLFHLAPVSIYRKVAQSRRGLSAFPLPLGNRKERLRWSKEAILAYYQHSIKGKPLPLIESPDQRRKRNESALASLRKKGVLLTPTE